MNCSTFREKHSSLLDDVLDDREFVAMHRHLAECADCAAYDAHVRRALLLFRDVPLIEASASFAERLSVRLHQERRAAARAGAASPTIATRGPGLGVFAAAAVSVAAVGYVAAATFAPRDAARELSLPPVVATRPAAPPAPVLAAASDAGPSPVSSPALMASVSTGMPLWPTALLVDQAPLNFATSEFQLTSYGR